MLSRKSILSSLIVTLMLFLAMPAQSYTAQSVQRVQERAWYKALSHPMKQARSREEITNWIQQNRGFGLPQTTLIEGRGRQVLVAWVNPFTGSGAVFAFAFTRKGGGWLRSMKRIFKNTKDLRVTLDNDRRSIVFKSVNGELLLRQGF